MSERLKAVLCSPTVVLFTGREDSACELVRLRVGCDAKVRAQSLHEIDGRDTVVMGVERSSILRLVNHVRRSR